MPSIFRLPPILLGSLGALAGMAFAAGDDLKPRRTQSITLTKGWNSIFLEVHPPDSDPETVFGSKPIDRVATLFQSPTRPDFVSNPEVPLSIDNSWAVWYSADLPERFLSSLDGIPGHQPYLVHAREACILEVEGEVALEEIRWVPDAFNLVGFGVVEHGAPTFAEFFAGSPAHAGRKIYRMSGGNWRQVLHPTSETMRSGEAFWVFCEGPSTFQGPLGLEIIGGSSLVLGKGAGTVNLRNAAPHPLSARIEHLAAQGPPVPLSVMVRTIGDPAAPVQNAPLAMPPGPWTEDLPQLQPGNGWALPLACRMPDMVTGRQCSLLKVTSDLGTCRWIPITGYRDDLAN